MHVNLALSLTTLASQYPPGLCAEFARAIAQGRSLAGDFRLMGSLGIRAVGFGEYGIQ